MPTLRPARRAHSGRRGGGDGGGGGGAGGGAGIGRVAERGGGLRLLDRGARAASGHAVPLPGAGGERAGRRRAQRPAAGADGGGVTRRSAPAAHRRRHRRRPTARHVDAPAAPPLER
ncbi:hypothetical protein R5R35_013127 [Gryllus longicercus]|uniref:Uncharacterized protein n=1 Tax=Gryllus longicercus TaxID=2509291 RepID=A0AAN9ZIH8_9ORTH